ncbi:heavy-metal-associated domain-containing protein [Defluviitalea phaphyphila]|uniref:heavy-metal-associated domain-containing protein n=1 Tax=Defluviitalea phaphyphila TaxID=1473580 RepID=UPI000731DF29|nr:heavy metal-associated domain-containing protein [Defluviitalea phaphyphila]
MKKKLYIEGMSCNHCVNHVKNALMDVEGVKEVEVSLEGKYAIVETDVEIKNEILKEAVVEEAGYELTKIENI